MGKKSGATATSKISSSSALANTTTNNTTSASSAILKSSFAPTYLQLHLFASVIQSFESQQLRIHDVSNGRLRQQHAAPAGTNITCLEWGHYGQSYRDQRNANKKKRKRAHDSQEDVVVAYGTSSSTICMYSPAEDKIVGVLRNGHERDIKDFRFLPSDNLQAWSIGADSKLVQWDLNNDQPTRYVPAFVHFRIQLANNPQINISHRFFDPISLCTLDYVSSDYLCFRDTLCDSYRVQGRFPDRVL